MSFVRHSILRQMYRKNIVKPLDEQRRSILDFAAEEIIIPRGKFRGQPYDPKRKPASELWFRELDSKRWQIHNYTGPTQSGKTLDAFIIPILYCLFEKEEDVIVGIPDMKMSMAKWKKDILPVIERTRYKHLLPKSGKGSRGGEVQEVAFLNGTHLTFMSFGGGDKSRAGDTAPNLIITETDGANDVSATSDEGTAIQQLIGRTLSYDLDAFIVMECTVTTDLGITWQTHMTGSESKIVRPCPHCEEFVAPERKHFLGWQDAPDEIAAGEGAEFQCPACAKPWTDEQRYAANRASVLLHKGQSIDKTGKITGELPRTSTLGFRCSAIDNFLRTSVYLGRIMWKSDREEDREAAERTIKQQQFAEPVTSSDDELPPLNLYRTSSRIVKGLGASQQATVPDGYNTITVGTDLRKTQLHWVVQAWKPDATVRAIDYGIYPVYSRKWGEDRALRYALTHMREVFESGFQSARPKAPAHRVDQWWIDAGWETGAIYKFIKETRGSEYWRKHCYPYIGRGIGKQYKGNYNHPDKPGGNVLKIIEKAHQRYNVQRKCPYWMVDAVYWKVFVHNRLRIPLYKPEVDDGGNPVVDDDGNELEIDPEKAELNPGAMSLFVPRSGDHLEYCRHLLSERQKTVFIPDKGPQTTMVVLSQVNHFLDATYAGAAAANYCGVHTTPEVRRQISRPRNHPGDHFGDGDLVMPDGQVFNY